MLATFDVTYGCDVFTRTRILNFYMYSHSVLSGCGKQVRLIATQQDVSRCCAVLCVFSRRFAMFKQGDQILATFDVTSRMVATCLRSTTRTRTLKLYMYSHSSQRLHYTFTVRVRGSKHDSLRYNQFSFYAAPPHLVPDD